MNDLNERYSRQMLFAPIGEAGQRSLGEKSALIVGVGALGTVIANHLVRAGIGHIRIADRDYVEKSNLQRQMLFDEYDAANAMPKAVAAERTLQRINSEVEVKGFVTDVTMKSLPQLMDGMDIVIDGTDNFHTRFLLNDCCFKNGIPFVYGGAVASRGMTAMFIPGKTPCLRCLVPEASETGETCDRIGVLSPVVDVAASFQAIEVLKYLLEDVESYRSTLLTFDMWENRIFEMNFSDPDPDCPTCQRELYPAMKAGQNEAVALCGRETVQIHEREGFDLKEWKEKLLKVGKVTETPFLLRVELPGREKLVLFPDGRVLVQGTDELARAKSIYARYIGL